MTNRPHPRIAGLVSLLAATSPVTLEACGICATAVADRVLPPIYMWAAFSPAWYLLVSIVIAVSNQDEHEIHVSVGRTLGVIVVAFLAGAFCLGLAPLALLAVFPLKTSLDVYRSHANLGCGAGRRARELALVGGAVCFTLLIGYSAYVHATRSRVEYLLQWQSAGPASATIRDMVSDSPADLNDLRLLVVEGRPWTAAEASKGLAKFGDPRVDVPLLIAALERAWANAYDEYPAREIEESLASLSGIQLPEGTEPEEWKAAWAARASETRAP